MEEEEAACSYAMILVSMATLPMAVKAMVELDVFEIIRRAGAGAHLRPDEIVAQLPAHKNPEAASMLDRILRLLASNSILSCFDDESQTLPDGRVGRAYGLGPVCKYLCKNEEGVNYGAFTLMTHDKVIMESWYHLKDAILEGGVPFTNAYGKGLFEYTITDSRFNQIFNLVMANRANFTMEKIIENYKGFDDISTLIDVGGGTGKSLSMIISKYPKIKGINYDLPHVVEIAPTYLGVEHVAGDMFASVPTGDAIFMKSICHDWDDEKCIKILENCYAALPKHGKVINCDLMLPETVHDMNSLAAKMVFQYDLLVLTQTGGKERTSQQFNNLAKAAGFLGFKVVSSAFDFKVMEFTKYN